MQRVDTSAVSEEEAAASAALKAAKLDAVDKLLWGTQAKRPGTASNSGVSGYAILSALQDAHQSPDHALVQARMGRGCGLGWRIAP